MKEMVGGCCVCSDERGWPENPLVYCDGQGCTVAVHQACYGIVVVPQGPWYCRKCESPERSTRVRCELCPSRDGALKITDNPGGWAHVVCALYIPEVRFGNVTTMEPIILQLIPPERYNKTCYICQENGKGNRASAGACMQCNKSGCKQQFHVTCAQQLGLLCEEAGNYLDNVKYCGYCQYHYSKLKKGGNVKPIPPYKPIAHDAHSSDGPSSPEKELEKGKSAEPSNNTKQRKSSNASKSSSSSVTGSNQGAASGQSSSSSNSLSNTTSTLSNASSTNSSSLSTSSGFVSGKTSSSSMSSSGSSSSSSKHKGSSSGTSGKTTSSSKDKESSSTSSSSGSSRSSKSKNKDYDPSQSNTATSHSKSDHSKDSNSATTNAKPPVSSQTNPIVQPARLTAVSPSLGVAPGLMKGEMKHDPKDVFTPKFTTSNFTEISNTGDSGNSSGGSGGGKKRKSDGRIGSGTVVDDSNKDLIRDVSVTLVPLQGFDKLDSADAEKSIKKFCISQPKAAESSTTTATIVTSTSSPSERQPTDVNSQNLSPNIVSLKQQQQVIQQNVQSSNSASVTSSHSSHNNGKPVPSQSVGQHQATSQPSLVVSVPLSTANVPGVNLNLPQNNNNNNNNTSSSNNNLPPVSNSGSGSLSGSIYGSAGRNEQLQNLHSNRHSPAIPNHQNAQMLERESSLIHRTASPAMHVPTLEHGGGTLHGIEMQSSSTMLKITYEKPNRATLHEDPLSSRRSRSRSIDSGPNSNGFGSNNGSNSTSSSNNSGASNAAPFGAGSGVVQSSGTKGPKGGRSSKNKRGGGAASANDLSQLNAEFEAGSSSASNSKIRRTPTSNIEQQQSPPHPSIISRTPESAFGGLKFGYEAQTPVATSQQAAVTNPLQIIATQTTIKESPQSSPGSEQGGSSKKRIKKSTPTEGGGGSKLFQNGMGHVAHMLGNSLNPHSSVAAKMTDTLNQEIEAHIANTVPDMQHAGPMYPGKIQAARPSALSTHGSQSLSSMLTGNPTAAGSTPQSLEQLLERQWEQGSQFLMEQAQHFDIASLLSCLHQLKSENVRLEEHVTSLVARRDHLLAVNARLAIPLNPPTANSAHFNNMHGVSNGPIQSENVANAAAAAVNSNVNSNPPSSGSGGSSSRRGSGPTSGGSVPQPPYNAGHGQPMPMENGIDFRHSGGQPTGAPVAAHSSSIRHSSNSNQSYSSNSSRQSSSSAGVRSSNTTYITQQVFTPHQAMRREDGSVKPS